MKILYYALIILGALDIIIWLLTGFETGWIDIFGVEPLSRHGWWLMIGTGIYFLSKQKAKEKSEIEDVKDLEEGEQIVYKNVSASTIITLTTKKIIFRAFDNQSLDGIAKNFENVIVDEKRIFLNDEITSVKSVKCKDIAKRKIGKLNSTEFGISLVLKNGETANLMTSKSELIVAHISKNINP